MSSDKRGLDHYAPTPARENLTAIQVEICQRVMDGKSMRAICADDGMPSKATVFQWLATDAQFRAAYVLAKQLLAETLAEEIIEIADDVSADWVEGENGPVFDNEHVQRSRLRVDSRKWLGFVWAAWMATAGN